MFYRKNHLKKKIYAAISGRNLAFTDLTLKSLDFLDSFKALILHVFSCLFKKTLDLPQKMRQKSVRNRCRSVEKREKSFRDLMERKKNRWSKRLGGFNFNSFTSASKNVQSFEGKLCGLKNRKNLFHSKVDNHAAFLRRNFKRFLMFLVNWGYGNSY